MVHRRARPGNACRSIFFAWNKTNEAGSCTHVLCRDCRPRLFLRREAFCKRAASRAWTLRDAEISEKREVDQS